MQTRRDFIKNSCVACMGLSAFAPILASCGTTQSVVKPTLVQYFLSVPLAQFANTPTAILRHHQLEYDILVVKQENEFTALQMRCTHNDIALTFSGKKLICQAHGSEFDLKGQVTKAPAAANLHTYRTSVKDSQLIIHLNS